MAIPTLKAGWLLRQSSILKRWKRSWFVLYADGNLAYFEDDSLQERQGNVSIPLSCVGIKTALECAVNPPEDRNYGGLFKLIAKPSEDLVLCAFNSDEALGWKMMIEQFMQLANSQRPPNNTTTTTIRRYNSHPNIYRETRSYPVQQNVPVYCYPNYGPVQVFYNAQGQPYYVHPQTRVIHIVQENDPYYHRSGNFMWGLAAGAALGTALYSPFFFF